MRSISRTYVGKTYSRARSYNCSLREFKVRNSLASRGYLLQFNILSCAFSSLPPVSFLPYLLSLLLSGVCRFQFRTFCIFGTVIDRKQLPNTASCGHLACTPGKRLSGYITCSGYLTITASCMAFHTSFDHRLPGYCGDSARSIVYRGRILYSRCLPSFSYAAKLQISSLKKKRGAVNNVSEYLYFAQK